MGAYMIHRAGDSVGVATEDLDPGSSATGRYRDEADGDTAPAVEVVDAVPLGHKIALTDLAEGDKVIEYGVEIGVATTAVTVGQHVHTHNLKGQRWA